jgi:hypothetical protein
MFYVFISSFSSFILHVSGFHKPFIRGISSCCLYATIWFMCVFVDHLRAPADWFVVVSSLYHHKPVRRRTQMVNKNTHEPMVAYKQQLEVPLMKGL